MAEEPAACHARFPECGCTKASVASAKAPKIAREFVLPAIETARQALGTKYN
jgi:hypothetical protein